MSSSGMLVRTALSCPAAATLTTITLTRLPRHRIAAGMNMMASYGSPHVCFGTGQRYDLTMPRNRSVTHSTSSPVAAWLTWKRQYAVLECYMYIIGISRSSTSILHGTG